MSCFAKRSCRSIKNPHVGKLSCAFIICVGFAPTPALAQNAGAGPQAASQASNPPNNDQIGDIIVTAQRREQRLQDIPISVTAVNAEAMRARGIENVAELARVDPSLQVPQVVGVYLPFLRGIGNPAAGNLGNESSVPVYIDDMYYTRLSTAYLAINSIDRVEILKGPQGTLFGRNASGGAIQMFTRDPGTRPEVDASVGYANYQRVSGQLYLSTPITDTLGWNLSVAGTDQGKGWGRSLADGHEIFKEKFITARSKIVWNPTDLTQVKIVGFYAYSKGDIGMVNDRHSGTYASSAMIGPVPGYPFPAIQLPSLADVPGDHFYDTRSNLPQFAREEGGGGSIRIDQKLRFADLVSISGFRTSKDLIRLDADITGQNFINGDLNSHDSQITQELQLKSKARSKIQWIVGAYYLHSNVKYDPIVLYGDAFGGSTVEIRSRQIVDSYSAFGQATAPVADKTNLTLGLRYNIDHLVGDGISNGFHDSKTFRKATWKGAVDHHFTDDVMGYASVSRGYKSGAFKTFPLDSPPVLPEVIDSYEVGLKTKLFDHHVRANAALFWNEIKNPQVLSVLSVNGVPQINLSNAKKARVKGAEAEVEVRPTRSLTLRGAVTYLDGKYISYVDAPFYCLNGVTAVGPPEGNPCPRPATGANGHRLPNVPKWAYDLGANYVVDGRSGKWVADVGLSHTGSFAWNPDNYVFEKPVTLLNASLSFTPSALHWLTITAWGKNLGNIKYYSITQESTGLAGTAGFQSGAAAPRTYGGTLRVRY